MDVWQQIVGLVRAGGWVMWPLLALSTVSLAVSFERLVFWASTHRPWRLAKISRITKLVRAADLAAASAEAAKDRSIYGRYLRTLLARIQEPSWGGRPMADSFAHEQAERLRPAIERFGATMSTIITAAPMLGILGTVTGIIRSFRLIGDAGVVTDPTAVAAGIGEALFTTAFGLIVALITLFPYAAFRAQAERSLNRLEVLGATMIEASRHQAGTPMKAADAKA